MFLRKIKFALFGDRRIPAFTEYGDLKSNNRFYRTVMIGLIMLLFISIQRDPFVIRYAESGAFVESPQPGSHIENEDVEIFIKHFLEKVNLFASYSLESHLPDALNMMTPELRRYYQSEILTDEALKRILDLRTRSTIQIDHIDLYREDGLVIASVTYKREVIFFEKDTSEIVPVRAEMVIEVMNKRTKQYLYGMRLKAFKEFSLN